MVCSSHKHGPHPALQIERHDDTTRWARAQRLVGILEAFHRVKALEAIQDLLQLLVISGFSNQSLVICRTQ